jgi:hypothetical protein
MHDVVYSLQCGKRPDEEMPKFLTSHNVAGRTYPCAFMHKLIDGAKSFPDTPTYDRFEQAAQASIDLWNAPAPAWIRKLMCARVCQVHCGHCSTDYFIPEITCSVLAGKQSVAQAVYERYGENHTMPDFSCEVCGEYDDDTVICTHLIKAPDVMVVEIAASSHSDVERCADLVNHDGSETQYRMSCMIIQDDDNFITVDHNMTIFDGARVMRDAGRSFLSSAHMVFYAKMP